MSKKFFTAFFLLGALCTQAQSDSSRTLDQVVISATRFPQKQSSTGKVITVIGRETLERYQGRTFTELLSQQAGLFVAGANNTPGSPQSIFMRGSGTGNTLLLVDGVPVSDPSTISNEFDFNSIVNDQIERLEIMKGGHSTLYGSDAVAGVINIITRKGSGRGNRVNAGVSGGSYDSYRLNAGVSGQADGSSYSVQFNHNSSGGFSAAWDPTRIKGFDRDGFKQNNLQLNFSRQIVKGLEARIYSQLSRYRADVDAAAFSDEKDFTITTRNAQLGAILNYRFRKGQVALNLNRNWITRNYLDDSISKGSSFAYFSKSEYAGQAGFAELNGQYRFNDHFTLLLGADYRKHTTSQDYLSLSSFGPYSTSLSGDSAAASQYSGYASLTYQNKGWTVEAGGRFNHHSIYGNNSTYSFNPSYLANGRWKFFANLYSAYRTPSIFQLFDIASGFRGLKPERSSTYEGGIQLLPGKSGLGFRAVYFMRNIKDGIEYDLVNFRYFNNNSQKDRGFELEAGWKWEKLSLTGNYSFVTGEVNTTRFVYDAPTFSYLAKGDTAFNNLFRRPKHAVNLNLGYQCSPAIYLAAHLRTAGERQEPVFGAAPLPLAPYYTLDFYGEAKAGKHVKFFADLRNITNQRYFDIRGYTTRGFNFMLGANVYF